MFSAEFTFVKANNNCTLASNINILYTNYTFFEFLVKQNLIKIYSKTRQMAPVYNIIIYDTIVYVMLQKAPYNFVRVSLAITFCYNITVLSNK